MYIDGYLMLLSFLSQVIVFLRPPRVYGGFGLLKLHNIDILAWNTVQHNRRATLQAGLTSTQRTFLCLWSNVEQRQQPRLPWNADLTLSLWSMKVLSCHLCSRRRLQEGAFVLYLPFEAIAVLLACLHRWCHIIVAIETGSAQKWRSLCPKFRNRERWRACKGAV